MPGPMSKTKSARNIAIAPRSPRYLSFNNTKRAGSTSAQVDMLHTIMRRNDEVERGLVTPVPKEEAVARLASSLRTARFKKS